MHAQYTTFVALVLGWPFCVAGIAAEVTQYSIEDFLDTTHYRSFSFSPNKKKILVSSDATGIFNAFAISVSDGGRQQLTESKTDSIFVSGGYFPDDERFIYSSDQGGNEFNHVFVRQLDGSVRDLTPGKEFKAEFFGWSYDDKSFFLGTTEPVGWGEERTPTHTQSCLALIPDQVFPVPTLPFVGVHSSPQPTRADCQP